jgi:superfamily II DNA or RNA helicase
MNLRPYQTNAIQTLADSFRNGNKSVIFCLPTGGGKTVCFSEIARRAIAKNPTKKVLILTDRIELLSQAGGALRRAGLDIGVIMANGSSMIPRNNVIVGMVETYARRIAKGWKINNLSLIIIDEAHKGNFKKIINLHSQDENIRIIGATATPITSSKKDPLKNYYADIVVGTDIAELIELGFLAKPRYFAVKADITAKIGSDGDYKTADLFKDFNKKSVYEGCVDNYTAHAKNKKTLVFCVNIEHAQNTCQSFIEAGYEQVKYMVSEGITPIERKQMLKWFAETPNAILVNVGILSTGFDEPTVECVILNRATKSLPLYLQMVGRGARVTPEKDNFIVIDMGNNVASHGFWNDVRDWKEMFFNPNQPKERKGEDIDMTKECPQCQNLIHISKMICEGCGYEFPKKEVISEFAITEEIDPLQFSYLYKVKPSVMTIDELIMRAKLGNPNTGASYKKGWVIHQLLERENPESALREYAQKMGYKEGWVKYQIQELQSV